MLRFRLIAALFLAACALRPAVAQDIRVLKVERPTNYNPNHKSTESLKVTLAGDYVKDKKIYMRVFYDDLATLKKLASYAGKRQCTRYTHFVRLEVDPSDGAALRDVLNMFRSTMAMKAEYTVVFEQGEEAPGMENVILLDKHGADVYFANALPLYLTADGTDEQNKEGRRKASFLTAVINFFDVPVFAAGTPAPGEPAPPKHDVIDAPHCMAIGEGTTVVKPVYELAALPSRGAQDALASILPGGLTLHARRCGG